MSGSVGELNQVVGEKTRALIDRAIRTASQHEVSIGISTGATDRKTLEFWYKRGMNILSSGMDSSYILAGAGNTLSPIRHIFCDAA